MIRFLDFIFSLLGIILLFPVFLVLYFAVRLESKGGCFYKQLRVGRGGTDFYVYKFRSMRIGADKQGLITVGGRDPRITQVGYFIRKYKLDELPQLFNVLKGDMSLVGPRPEVRKYVELYTDEQRKILEITSNLNEAEAELTDILRQLGVIDTHIWIGQVKAILNPKEMVEVRHNLSIRRQKLREQIEYNESRIEDARNNIKNVTKKNKVHAKEAMQVLEIYEKRHKNN